MTPREQTVELLAQTLAPRLYKLCGVRPDEMGFPFGETKDDVEDKIERQFNPVNYWLGRSREIAESILRILEAGGIAFDAANIDAMLKAAAKERPDVQEDGTQSSLDELA